MNVLAVCSFKRCSSGSWEQSVRGAAAGDKSVMIVLRVQRVTVNERRVRRRSR